MAIFSLIISVLMGLLVLCIMVLAPTSVILAIIGFVKKDFSLFKRFLKYLGFVILAQIILVTVWGLLSVLTNVNK